MCRSVTGSSMICRWGILCRSDCRHIRKYFYMGTGCAVVGEAAGIVLGNFLGERICGMALKSFGAEGFRFVCDWTQILIRIPGIALVAAILAVWIGTSDIYSVKAYECCRDRE